MIILWSTVISDKTYNSEHTRFIVYFMPLRRDDFMRCQDGWSPVKCASQADGE